MNRLKLICTGTMLLMLGAVCANVMADDVISAEDFVEEASAKGYAEIETGKLALEKSQTQEVRDFAQTMITDHGLANKELAVIAQKKNLDVADDTELLNKAKAFILKQRDGQSFDEAYANNQVMAHEQTIELFQKATRMNDAELKAFAQKTLPKLQHHLDMANQLVDDTSLQGTGQGGRDIDSDASVRDTTKHTQNSL
jgi:putative membrane protein